MPVSRVDGRRRHAVPVRSRCRDSSDPPEHCRRVGSRALRLTRGQACASASASASARGSSGSIALSAIDRPRRLGLVRLGSAIASATASAMASSATSPRRQRLRDSATASASRGLGDGLLGSRLGHRRLGDGRPRRLSAAASASVDGLGSAAPRRRPPRRRLLGGRLRDARPRPRRLGLVARRRVGSGLGASARGDSCSAICWRTWANAAARVLSMPPSGSWTACERVVAALRPGPALARSARGGPAPPRPA